MLAKRIAQRVSKLSFNIGIYIYIYIYIERRFKLMHAVSSFQ